MMRLILLFSVLLISVLAGLQFSHNPGYVLIAFNHWTIETTLWFALLALLLLFFLLYTLCLLFGKIESLSLSWKRYHEERQKQKIQDAENQATSACLQQNLWLSSIQELIKNNQPEALDKLMRDLPRKFRDNPVLLSEYLRFLVRDKQHAKAEALLRKQLKYRPEKTFVDLYGLCHHNDKQLVFAENILKKQGPSASLYLCLGRLALEQKLWGKARDYLEKSIELEPAPAAYQALGMLHDALHEPEAASKSYRQGLALLP